MMHLVSDLGQGQKVDLRVELRDPMIDLSEEG